MGSGSEFGRLESIPRSIQAKNLHKYPKTLYFILCDMFLLFYFYSRL